jgi:hypothetical protein
MQSLNDGSLKLKLREQIMNLTQEELQQILESLDPKEWANPRIMTFNDEYRLHHVLVATKPDSGKMYYYEPESSQFEPLGV